MLEAWSDDARRRRAVPGVVVGTAVGADAARARRPGVADAVSEAAEEPFERTRRRRRGRRRADRRRRRPPPSRHRRGDRARAAPAGSRSPAGARRAPSTSSSPRPARRRSTGRASTWCSATSASCRPITPTATTRWRRPRCSIACRCPPSQIHRIEGERGDAAGAADAYAAVLSRAFALAPGRLARAGSRAAGRRPRRPHRVAVPAHAGARRRRSPGRRGGRAVGADVSRHADLPGPERGPRRRGPGERRGQGRRGGPRLRRRACPSPTVRCAACGRRRAASRGTSTPPPRRLARSGGPPRAPWLRHVGVGALMRLPLEERGLTSNWQIALVR